MVKVEFCQDFATAEIVELPSGRPHIGTDAEADAEYSERPGRSSLEHGAFTQVSFRVSQSVKDELRELAIKLGRTEEDVAHEAFSRGLQLVA